MAAPCSHLQTSASTRNMAALHPCAIHIFLGFHAVPSPCICGSGHRARLGLAGCPCLPGWPPRGAHRVAHFTAEKVHGAEAFSQDGLFQTMRFIRSTSQRASLWGKGGRSLPHITFVLAFFREEMCVKVGKVTGNGAWSDELVQQGFEGAQYFTIYERWPLRDSAGGMGRSTWIETCPQGTVWKHSARCERISSLN